MRSFTSMLIANIKMQVRNKAALFWNLIFPAIFIIMFGSVMGNQKMEGFDVGIAGATTPLRQSVVSAMKDSDGAFKVHEGAEADELKSLKDNDRSVVLVFPDGQGTLQMYTPGGRSVTNQISSSAVRNLLSTVLGKDQGLDIQEQSIDAKDDSYMTWFMPGILAMTLMNTGIIGISTTFASLRDRGTLRRIKVTPFPLWKFLLARVVSSLIMTVLYCAILLGLGKAFFDLRVRGNWFLIIGVLLLVALTMLAIGYAIAAISRNTETAAGISNMITFPMMFLSGVFFPLNAMPKWLAPLVNLMPLKYAVHALRLPMQNGDGIGAIGTDLAVLVALFVVAMIFAVRFFKWEPVTR